MRLRFNSLHHIDLEADCVRGAGGTVSQTDVEAYVNRVFRAVSKDANRRMFSFSSDTTEVHAAVRALVKDGGKTDSAECVANRLLRCEKAAQEKYKHIAEIHKGSILQAVCEDAESVAVLLAKVDHNSFLDEQDLRTHIGLPFERQVLKACLIDLDGGDFPFVTSVRVYDSNSRLTEYWWHDFLELTEITTDEQNTGKAFNAIDSFLARRLKRKSKPDYTELRNNLVSYFRTRADFSIDSCVESVCGDYIPESADVDTGDLETGLRGLPDKRGFDRKFSIKPDVVKARFRRRISLTDKIDLVVKGAVENLAGTVQSVEHQGKKYVRIRSDSGYDHFRRLSHSQG